MRYILLFLFVNIQLQTHAQLPVLQHYGVDDGLAGSCVYRAIQDSKGFMWLMTDRGLSRFDGSRFQNFTMADGLPQNDVFLVGEDRHQRLWIYSWNDIFCYFDLNKNHFSTIPNTSNAQKQGFINYFFDTDTGLIVYAHGGNFYKINDKQEVSLNPHNTNTSFVHKKFMIQRQYPMITGELIQYQKNEPTDTIASLVHGHDLPTKIIYYQPKPNTTNRIALADSALFVLTGDWLDCYYKNKHVRKHIRQLSPSFESNNTIKQLDVVGGNTRFVYIKTSKDCFIVDENLNRQNAYNFIKQLDINGVNADKDGNLWISTKENGVYILEKNIPKKLSTVQLTSNSVKSIVKDVKGNLIIGNNLGEIHILKQGKLSKISFDKPINFSIKTLKALPDGRVCVTWKDYGFTILSPQHLYANKVIKTQIFEFVDTTLKISLKGYLPIIACLTFKDISGSPQNDIVFATRKTINLIRDSANYWILRDIATLFFKSISPYGQPK